MSLSVRQQATQLLERFAEAQAHIDKLKPFGQILEARKLSEDIQALNALQKRVESAWFNKRNAIPDVSAEDLIAVTEKLRASSEILDKIKLNTRLALICIAILGDTTYEVERIACEIRPSSGPLHISVQSFSNLTSRASRLATTPHINAGNSDMLENLQLSCSEITREIERLNAHPSSLPPDGSDKTVSEKLHSKVSANL